MAGFGLPFFSPFVNTYTKVAEAVIRLVAFVFVVTSFLLYAVDPYVCSLLFPGHYDMLSLPRPLPRPGLLALKAIPFLIGVALVCASRALAVHFTKDLD
jgi:hypothetical protein